MTFIIISHSALTRTLMSLSFHTFRFSVYYFAGQVFSSRFRVTRQLKSIAVYNKYIHVYISNKKKDEGGFYHTPITNSREGLRTQVGHGDTTW